LVFNSLATGVPYIVIT